jgi:tight adherence protein C
MGSQQKLVTAGYRGSEALPIFIGIRLGVALLAFGAAVAVTPKVLLAIGAAALGYLLAGMYLGRLAKKRQHRIRCGLPDALDLLVVSVEAGLGLDQAIQRVAEELGFAHPTCATARLINLELRAGKTASTRCTARRSHRVEDAVARVHARADKFGTSVAQSPRVHSGTVRTKRRQRAEEAAAKTGAKMVFRSPASSGDWVVTIGPAAIKFIRCSAR